MGEFELVTPCSQCGSNNWMKSKIPVYLVPALWDAERKHWVGYAGSKDKGPESQVVDAFECIKCRQVIFFATDEPRQGD